jgi:hypothetical protein
MDSSNVAVWSFQDAGRASEATARLRSASIHADLLSGHDNLYSNVWLLVSPDQREAARCEISRMPFPLLVDALPLPNILVRDIPGYAASLTGRYRNRWFAWGILLLWPLGFYFRSYWGWLLAIAIFGLVMVLVSNGLLSCPCCRRFLRTRALDQSRRRCTSCGLTFRVAA